MAVILYEKNSGALIPNGDRTVVTYDSGLCRVDQGYTCNHSAAATHRAALAIGSTPPDDTGEPAIDGLSIYPAPQEVKSPEGFTEFKVSSYGRATSNFENYQDTAKAYFTSPTRHIGFMLHEVKGTIAAKRGESLLYDDLNLDFAYSVPFGYFVANSAWLILSIVTEETGSVNSVAWDGTQYTSTIFKVTITYDAGLEADQVETLFYNTPAIEVQNVRNFGAFTELEILTKVPTSGQALASQNSAIQ